MQEYATTYNFEGLIMQAESITGSQCLDTMRALLGSFHRMDTSRLNAVMVELEDYIG
jgi:hypothetical protein